MKQFLSLSFVLCLLLILPGCFCKKECGPVRSKPEKGCHPKGCYKRRPSRRQREVVQEEYLPAGYYDEDPMIGEEDYPVEERSDIME